MELVDLRPPCSMSGSELLTALDALHVDISTRLTYRLQILERLDEIGYAKELGAPDTIHLLSLRHRLDPADVGRDLKLATGLSKYPAVAAALPDPLAATVHDPTDALDADAADDGVVETPQSLPVVLHPAQAEAIVTALEKIPTAAMVPVEDLEVAEREMVKAARHLTPIELKKLGKRVRDTLDTDGPEPAEDKAYLRENLWLKEADHGLKFGGFLANENAEALKTAIHALAKPHKTIDGELDSRPRDKRQADALSTLLAIAAGADDTGHRNLAISVTIDYNDLKAAISNTNGDTISDASEGSTAPGQFGDVDTAGIPTAYGNQRTTGTGELIYGGSLSAGAIRRLACDAGIIPIVLGSNSEPLDVGMLQRFVNRAMRRALIRRDKGCVVCGAPPIHCDAHHLIHWADGGPTALWNLVLLCKAHHRGVHAGHWTIKIHNGTVAVSLPTWADPPAPRRTPLRLPAPGDPPTPAPPTTTSTRTPGRAHTPASTGAAVTSTAASPALTAAATDPCSISSATHPGPTSTASGATPPPTPASTQTPASAGAAVLAQAPTRAVRAWPYVTDVPWITAAEAIRLNPWGTDNSASPGP